MEACHAVHNSLMSSYNSDEDDTAELLRELQKIKNERAEEESKKVR